MTNVIKRKVIRIRHYIYHNKPVNFKHGKPCVWETAWDDTYLQTFYYNDNNELVIEHSQNYLDATLFDNEFSVMEYDGNEYTLNDVVKLLENHLKPKKDYYIKLVNYEVKIG